MRQLADSFARIDEELMEDIRPKIQDGSLGGEDMEKAFTLFGQVCNNTEEIRYEMNNMTQGFQFNLDEYTYFVVFDAEGCGVYSGAPPAPTVIFFISMKTALDIVTGNVHSSVAQMNGDIDYTGPRHDAIAFQRIFELFLDEFI